MEFGVVSDQNRVYILFKVSLRVLAVVVVVAGAQIQIYILIDFSRLAVMFGVAALCKTNSGYSKLFNRIV